MLNSNNFDIELQTQYLRYWILNPIFKILNSKPNISDIEF